MEHTRTEGQELVSIYITAKTALRGSGSVIQDAWESMLLSGEVDDVDLLESTPIINRKGKAKVLTRGDAILLFTDRARLPGVMTRLRTECAGTGLRAYAQPVLAAVIKP